MPGASLEAQRLLVYFDGNADHITLFQTQVGAQIAAQRARDPGYSMPPNVGELSIQSLLIELQITMPRARPVVLFEDGWFLRNARALAKPYLLLSTQAFLEHAHQRQWIPSVAKP